MKEQRLVDGLAGRRGRYAKDLDEEGFLEALNAYLEPRELELYEDRPIEHPFVFVIGAPRSGTTLLSQLLAYCLDVGYVTNVAARFWRAPVHGIRLSTIIAGDPKEVPFTSDYARTPTPLGIHEWGYFWSRWLQKDTFDDIVEAREREDAIDWDGLRRALANVQHELGGPFVAKNTLGAHHMSRLGDVLEKVVWVLVERDPLDVACSILDARRRYYGDESRWWSYVPPEYPALADLHYGAQIAGQVHYLGRFYERSLAELGEGASIRIRYADLCADPGSALDAVADRLHETHGERVARRREPPASFAFREYGDRQEDKRMFESHFDDLRAGDA